MNQPYESTIYGKTSIEHVDFTLVLEKQKNTKGFYCKWESGMQGKESKSEIHFIGTVEKEGEDEAQVRIYPEYCAGLKGIAEYSHAIILYWLHLRDNEKEKQTLLVFPKRHARNVETGVFACRSPSRPNPIGLCVVELLSINECVLTVRGLDAVENSPIIDMKPYLPRADSIPNARAPQWTNHGPKT